MMTADSRNRDHEGTGPTPPGPRRPAEPQAPNGARPADPAPLLPPVGVRSAALWVLVILGTIFVLRSARDVLIPIVFAVLLAYALAPIVAWLEPRRVPRPLAVTLVLILLVGGVGCGVYSLRGQAMQILEDLPDATRQVRDALLVDRRENGTLEKVRQAATGLEKAAAEATGDDPSPPRGVTRVEVVERLRVREYLWTGSLGVAAVAGQIGVVIFLVFFFLLSGDLFKRKLVRIAGPSLSSKKVTVNIIDEINRQIGRYLLIRISTSALVAVVTWAGLLALGLEQPAIWGLAAGVLNMIPYFGPLIATAAVGIVAFVQFGAMGIALAAAGIVLVVTGLEGWLLTPPLIGRAARMNEVSILVGLLFWTWVWGVWGTILAVPIMMTIKTICDRVEDLQPVGEVLGK